MKRTLQIVLVLVMALTLTLGLTTAAGAVPAQQNGNSLSIVQPGGGAYIHVTNQITSEVSFNYGWDNSNHFASPVGSYWIGVYDVTQSSYVWGTGWVNVTDQSKLKLSETVSLTQLDNGGTVASGDAMKFVFFVRTGPDGAGDILAMFEDASPDYNTIVFTAP